jgi:3-methylcrotonyl-CoA carboxylase alpha subunit
MEMNTRLQVEHPVTEASPASIWSNGSCASPPASPAGDAGQISIKGHAFEARLYAEDPESGFLPSTGKLFALDLPEGEGARVDSGVRAGRRGDARGTIR